MKEEKVTMKEKLEAEQNQEIRKQMDFQMQMYKDKKDVEILSMLLTVLKEIQFKDPSMEANLESKLYTRLMEYAESSKKLNNNSGLIK